MSGSDDDDFNNALSALQKSSETSRAIFSTFFVIYSAVVMFALSAFVVPNEQDRIHALSDDLTRAMPCIFFDPAKTPDKVKDCSEDYNNIIMSPTTLYDFKNQISLPTDQQRFLSIVQQANTDVFSHRLIKMLDVSDDVSRFTIPVVGIQIDRNWFGYMNATGGVFFYFIILHALENQIVLLDFVRRRATNNLLRLQVTNATQVFTSSGRFPPYLQGQREQTSRISHVVSWSILPLKKSVFLAIVAFPLFVAVAVEWDTLHILLPNRFPSISNFLAWVGSPAPLAQEVLFPSAASGGGGSAVFNVGHVKEHLLFMVLLFFNSLGIVVMIGLLRRLQRRVWQLFQIDDENMAELENIQRDQATAQPALG